MSKTNCLIIIILFSISCSVSNERKIEEYIIQVLDFNMKKQDNLYIVFSMNSCQDCLVRTKKILLQNINNYKDETTLNIVVSGNSKRSINLFLGQKLRQKSNIIYDLKNSLINKSFFKNGYFYFLLYKNQNVEQFFKFNNFDNYPKFEESMQSF
jgi:hypothetical protein